MIPLGGETATQSPCVLEGTVEAAEALCFARDLGGSLTHVIVAAVGRTLETSNGVVARLASRHGARGVGLVTVSAGEVAVNVVHSAEREPLPQVRAELDAILLAAHEGLPPVGTESRAAIAVVERGNDAVGVAEAALLGVPAVLEAGPLWGDPIRLELCLRLEAGALDGEGAEDLLAGVAYLLRRPYRRLL